MAGLVHLILHTPSKIKALPTSHMLTEQRRAWLWSLLPPLVRYSSRQARAKNTVVGVTVKHGVMLHPTQLLLTPWVLAIQTKLGRSRSPTLQQGSTPLWADGCHHAPLLTKVLWAELLMCPFAVSLPPLPHPFLSTRPWEEQICFPFTIFTEQALPFHISP